MANRFWTHRRKRYGRWKYAAILVGAMLLQMLLALPAFSTERAIVSFGLIERSISVADLDVYARTGRLSRELTSFSRYFTPEQLAQVRSGLTLSADVDVVAVSQFLRTTQGDAILQELGKIIQTAGRQNGARAMRGALVLAAADPDGGFNALNVLKHFPTSGARVDLQQLSQLSKRVINDINQTQQAVKAIQQQATASGGGGANSFANLSAPGPERWQMQSFRLQLPTDLYVPERLPGGEKSPLVVISHGLGGDRTSFAYVAKHLASYGFAVAVVEHPGSSSHQIQALFTGQANQAIEPGEMIRRPIAIQTVLDQLEATAKTSAFASSVNFQRVGVLGQSLGAYTALALAGATVQRAALEQVCPPELSAQLNLSLLVQCPILALPQPLPSLRDGRIRAAIAINSLDSAVFGPVGMGDIAVPTMIVSGSSDTVAPALAEQIRPFQWLKARDRYLLMMKNGTHFSTIDVPVASKDDIPVPPEVIGPDSEAAQNYVRAMSLAFFKAHLAEDAAYQPYLSQSYAETISQKDLPLYLVQK